MVADLVDPIPYAKIIRRLSEEYGHRPDEIVREVPVTQLLAWVAGRSKEPKDVSAETPKTRRRR